MVRVCAFPGCFNQEKSLRLRQWASMQEKSLTFHTLPLNDVKRLNLWLLALRRDSSSPIQSVRGLRVCSEHFSPDDFSVAKGINRRLKSTAVPKQFVRQRTKVGVEIKIYHNHMRFHDDGEHLKWVDLRLCLKQICNYRALNLSGAMGGNLHHKFPVVQCI